VTAPDLRTIALPDTYTPASVRRRWNGCTVEVLPVPADSSDQITVRILDGPDKDRELWLHPTLLKLPDVGTENEW
jgi:hypothetical protein